MTPTETAAKLRAFNAWRRGGDIEQPGPLAVGEVIDAAVEMIDRLEAAESEALEEARLNGMGSEREAALMAKLEAAEKERDFAKEEAERLLALAHDQNNELIRLREEGCTLRTKIAEMERQEPVTWMQSTHLSSFKNRLCGSQSSYVHCSDHQLHPDFKPLYALPGAQPAPSVPDGWKLVPVEPTSEMLDKGSDQSYGYVSIALDVWVAMLAAAPEAKPCP